MTVKLVVLYTHPDDPAAFDNHYRDTHLPLAEAIPGLLRWEVARFGAAVDGSAAPYYQIAELYFEDQAAIGAAFGSDEGKATAADYGQIAPAGSQMYIAGVTASS
jgi:uncharacterized protein (TIGR02118 family)